MVSPTELRVARGPHSQPRADSQTKAGVLFLRGPGRGSVSGTPAPASHEQKGVDHGPRKKNCPPH